MATGRVEEADGLAEAARRYLTLAGDRSLGLDVAGAEVAYRSALELTAGGIARARPTPREARRGPLAAGRFSEANEMLEAAHALFLAVEDVRSGAVALRTDVGVLSRIGDTRTRGHTAAALELLAPLLPAPSSSRCCRSMHGEAYISDDLDRTIEASSRAIEVAETLGMPTPARALGFLGGARSLPIRPASTTCEGP